MPIQDIRSRVPKNYRDQSTVVNQAMGLYLGYIKNAEDVTRNGRLQVWIPEFNSNPDSKDSWVTISYVSPFAGSTSIFDMGKDGTDSYQTQKTYGLWAIPYDKDTPVLVGFINGDPQMGVYLGSLHQEFINHAIPGLGASKVHGNEIKPGAEKNRNDAVKDVAVRPKNKDHISRLVTQGLLTDTTRGVGSSSARRESPSRVIGLLSPGQHQLVMDDGDSDGNSSMIRLRTRGGAQIMINDQHGMVYVISRDGKTWMELGNDGNIDIYASNHVSLHAEKDFNIRAGNDVNIEAGSTVNIKGIAGVKVEAPAGSVDVFAGQNLNQQAGANANLLVAGSYKETAARIDMNGPASTPASRAYVNSHPANKLVRSSVASRVPEAEPWQVHKIHTNLKVEGSNPTTDTVRPTVPDDVANDVTYEDIPPKEEVDTEECLSEENRTISQPGIDFILSHEQYRPYEYFDFAGNSIGYGHNRGSGAKHGPEWEKKMDQGLTEEEAYELFRLDIKVVEKSVNRALKGAPCVTQNQFDALVSMAYNTGNVFYAIVDGQKYDLTGLYKSGNWDRVSQLIASDNRKNGPRERRINESKIMTNAEYGKRADRQSLKAGGLAAARKSYPNGFGSNTFGGVEKPRRQAEYVFYKETGRFLPGMADERKRAVVAQAGGSVPSVT